MKPLNKLKKIHPMYYVSFFLPVIIIICIFISRKIYPFGDNVYLRSDMYHQYCPFFSELWDKIRHGGSMFYTWDIGLGSNFAALYGYYLSSPLNWFIGFFPHKYMIEMMNIIIIIKLALASVTTTYYLSKRFKVQSLTLSVFGMFYALSGYTAAFSWNLMWFDCILLLPLTLLGLERLVNEDKGVLYTVTLGLTILSNYYISIMVCIGLIFYFIGLIIAMPVPKKKSVYLQKTGYFTIFSLLAGGLSAVILLPEVYALGLTASSDISFPKTLTQYFSMVTVLNRQLANTPVSIGLDHMPNIYCSVAVFLLFPLYIFNKKIGAREKIAKVFLLFIFIFAFSFNIPNFIWHGFHYPNSLPARQAFFYVFILLTICYDAFKDIKDYPDSRIVKSFGLSLLYLLWLDHAKGENDPDFKILYISALFMALYMLLIYIYKHKNIQKYFIIFFLFCISAVECTMNMEETGYSTTGRSYYFKDYDEINELTSIIEEQDDSFYRISKAFGYRSKNDSIWHDFKGASIFSSTAYAGVTDLYGNLGLEHSMNAYADHGATPLVYSMFDIKYILSNKEINNDSTLELIGTSGEEYLYECLYTLPIGYMVPSDINVSWYYNASDPAAVQNSFSKATCGIDSLMTPVDYDKDDNDGIVIRPDETSHLFVYIGNKSVKSVKVTKDGKNETFKGINHGRMVDLGICEAGSSITIVSDDGDSSMNPSVYAFNTEAFISIYNSLSSQAFELDDYSDTTISGSITALQSGIMMTSIPYDPSWSVKVDGKEVEIEEVAEALIGIPLSAGTHTVEFKYVPRGFVSGLLLTLASILVLVLIIIFYKKIIGETENIETAEISKTVETVDNSNTAENVNSDDAIDVTNTVEKSLDETK